MTLTVNYSNNFLGKVVVIYFHRDHRIKRTHFVFKENEMYLPAFRISSGHLYF